MIDANELLADLSVFSDLGVQLPQVRTNSDGSNSVAMTRNGDRFLLHFQDNGSVIAQYDNGNTKYANYKSLLSSPLFADLRDWASVQARVLIPSEEDDRLNIEVFGKLESASSLVNIEYFDDALVSRPSEQSAHIYVIDGPAGIGKTEFIRGLARRRAVNYLQTQRPLILHVQSRGRVLTFLQDLMAFSLQTLRRPVTFDQVPVLVRNGLITIAIDGFDELGDPSGYETAWAQVNDLINQVRGNGSILLAGRETFIGTERVRRDIKSIRSTDIVDSLKLQLPEPGQARRWLMQKGWTTEHLRFVDDLFEKGSFALRPLFLRRLAEDETRLELAHADGDEPLSLLVDIMIDREAGKFGDQVEAVLSKADREAFIRSFLGEIARDMADNQADAADDSIILWAAESVLQDRVPEDVVRLISNRAMVMAFLAPDERPRYRRFSHSQLQNYFLALETIATIRRKEVPKFIRRNIVAAEFLIAFSEIVNREMAVRPDDIREFFSALLEIISNYRDIDRGERNLSSILLASSQAGPRTDRVAMVDKHMDDVVIRGTASPFGMWRSSINQLDIRDADVSEIVLRDTKIGGLIINDLSRLNSSFDPEYIQVEQRNGKADELILYPNEIFKKLSLIGGAEIRDASIEQDAYLFSNHPVFGLLRRVLRHRGHWIRLSGDDLISAKIVEDSYWPTLKHFLAAHDFLKEEVRGAAGRSSIFAHVKRAASLSMDDPSEDALALYNDLLVFARAEQEQ